MTQAKSSKRQKKYQEILDEYINKKVSVDLAIELLKKMPPAKFDQTVELAVKLGIDMKQADQQVRSTVTLPAGTGKKTRVAVVAQGDSAKEALEAGADKVGAQEFIKELEAGQIDFDKLLATPDMMKEMGKLGRVLGPKGLMPNPKDGTVTAQIGSAVKSLKLGQLVSIRAEKEGSIVQLPIGKLSFKNEDLKANLKEAISTLQRIKPTAAKGVYFISAYVSSTMGPSIQIDPTKALAA
ncbi:MAG: 50S ribosomal protein L1 [Candidatus Caenarcaniphilales bacterium]|nr:50S ribosomal protein L1 [Candidatus Caenarcaniphilales bacterium]